MMILLFCVSCLFVALAVWFALAWCAAWILLFTVLDAGDIALEDHIAWCLTTVGCILLLVLVCQAIGRAVLAAKRAICRVVLRQDVKASR